MMTMGVLITMEKTGDDSATTTFKRLNEKGADTDFTYGEFLIADILGGKINDVAVVDDILIFSSENLESIDLRNNEDDYYLLFNQAVSLTFNQPFYGNVFLALIDDIEDEFIKELEADFVDSIEEYEIGFLTSRLDGENIGTKSKFYKEMIDRMLELLKDFMDDVKTKMALSGDEIDMEKLLGGTGIEFVEKTPIKYNIDDTDEFFKKANKVNTNSYFILYKQLIDIPIGKTDLEIGGNIELEMPTNKDKTGDSKYVAVVPMDKKIIIDFADNLLNFFESTEDYELCSRLKRFTDNIKDIDDGKK